ncbi:MAG TPA: spore coat protein U domain-containing protein [Solimonas sp.]
MLSLLLLLGLVALPLPSRAATTCSASMSDIVFGDVNPFGTHVDVQATLNYSCSSSGILGLGLLGARARLCFSIGIGTQGTALDPRRMASGANGLLFNLYKTSARNTIWGTRSDSYGAVETTMDVPVTLGSGSANGSLTVYGRVPASQISLVPGNYASAFSGSHTQLAYRYNEGLLNLTTTPASCASGGSGGGTGTFAFNAQASVSKRCVPNFAVQNIDFGTQGLLTSAIDTTATISPQCTNTTPYQIGLDNGLYASGNMRRMRSGANRHVTYELYRDTGRNQRWGNTQNVDTVTATGSGSAQNVTIYGRVAPQATPTAGSYSDTVTVTITY